MDACFPCKEVSILVSLDLGRVSKKVPFLRNKILGNLCSKSTVLENGFVQKIFRLFENL